VVETLLEDVDSYLDEASGKGANQQVRWARGPEILHRSGFLIYLV